jgi:hypothetical protein
VPGFCFLVRLWKFLPFARNSVICSFSCSVCVCVCVCVCDFNDKLSQAVLHVVPLTSILTQKFNGLFNEGHMTQSW